MEKREIIFLSALEENQDKLYRICSIYSYSHEDAKDLFQEVLVHIWKSMNSFKFLVIPGNVLIISSFGLKIT